MANFIGNTASTATKSASNIPQYIVGFSLCNRHNNTMTVNVGIVYGSTFLILNQHSLSAYANYIYSGEKIVIPVGYELFVSATESCDYIFTIE